MINPPPSPFVVKDGFVSAFKFMSKKDNVSSIFKLNNKYGFSITTSFNIAFMIIVLCLLISTIFYLKTDEV